MHSVHSVFPGFVVHTAFTRVHTAFTRVHTAFTRVPTAENFDIVWKFFRVIEVFGRAWTRPFLCRNPFFVWIISSFLNVIHIVMIGVFPSFHIFCIAYFGRKGGSPSSRDDFHAYAFIVLGFEGNQQFCIEINKMGMIV